MKEKKLSSFSVEFCLSLVEALSVSLSLSLSLSPPLSPFVPFLFLFFRNSIH